MMSFVRLSTFKKRPVAAIISAVTMILLFQNCGSFEAGGGVSGSALKLDAVGTTVPKGSVFRVQADLNRYPVNASFLWDHEYGTGLTYCQQTTSADKRSTDFLCPGEGTQRVSLGVYQDGKQVELETIEVIVGQATPAAPTVVIPPSATPTPVGLTPGQQLYQTHCSRCHNEFEQSNKAKRGVNLTRLNNAIAGNTGGMGILLNLVSAERDLIVQALQ